MQQSIISIIQEVLPNFWYNVQPYKNCFGETDIAIQIAPKDYLINGVSGQRPQAVSLRLCQSLELKVQGFGGCGGQVVYRKINPENPKEKYNYMAGERIPFRTPQKNEKAVLACVRKFCTSYLQILRDNKNVLMYQDIVDYDTLLGATTNK